MLLRVDLAPSGTERIEASSGHDDLADALALAMGPHRDAGKRWRTVLGGLADPRRPAPPPNLAAANVPTVATGAGVRVPAVPVFQSVKGRDLSIPPDQRTTPQPINPCAARAKHERLSKERTRAAAH